MYLATHQNAIHIIHFVKPNHEFYHNRYSEFGYISNNGNLEWFQSIKAEKTGVLPL